ncbi:MAG TPA: D-alanine--D-alanine ligase [Candidatus Saccharibacteria bacterium]|nr:D-alanine--D-alanine ligase [Patescibacteria group bacterium]HMS31361.1 D-alanine--D-alanine ligase [Candidatus Saccharibacteria bacterium]
MKTVAVIFGGQSTEHDVSIVTALSSVVKPLELTGEFEVEAIYVSKDGAWYWDDKLKDINLYTSGEIDEFIKQASKLHILFDRGLTIVKSSKYAGRKQYKKIDVVFPAMHGTHGEDGELMGILEMAGVPYVGCGLAASAIAMDKVIAKQVTQSHNIPSTPWVWFSADDLSKNPSSVVKLCNSLQYPLFVKPARLGSSIGISRVTSAKQLMNALEVAAHYDDKIIVEQAVSNLIEVTLPIMGNLNLTPALLEQPLLTSEDFFDFDTKYMQGGKKGKNKGSSKGTQGYSNLPADLPKGLYEKAEQLGLSAYRAVGCEGIARIDMLIDSKTSDVFFNEINPLPGGLYSHNWRVAGISNVTLVQKLIDLAEERFLHKRDRITSFNTNYLKQFK